MTKKKSLFLLLSLCGLIIFALWLLSPAVLSASAEDEEHVHSWNSGVVTRSATCTTAGTRTFTCSGCSQTKNESIAALGHSLAVKTVDGSCEEAGSLTTYCTRCSYSVTASIPNTGHEYVKETRAATCTEAGGVYYTCTICGFSYVDEIEEATGHDWGTAGELIQAPTCTQSGIRRMSCYICGETEELPIEPMGHNYILESRNTANGITTTTYRCSRCGTREITRISTPLARVAEYYVSNIFKPYSKYMGWLLLAGAALWGIPVGVSYIIAHRSEDRNKARKMLKNFLIGIIAIFCILVAAPSLIYGFAIFLT